MSLCFWRAGDAALKCLAFIINELRKVRGYSEYLQRDRYSGKPLVNKSRPPSLAGAFGGNSRGISSRDIMTIEQYAPLNDLSCVNTMEQVVLHTVHLPPLQYKLRIRHGVA